MNGTHVLRSALAAVALLATLALVTPHVGAAQVDPAPGAVGCTVLTPALASSAHPDLASITATSVDAAGVVHTLWWGQPDDQFDFASYVTATQPDGTTTVLMQSGDLASGVPIGLVYSLAVAPLSGNLYVSDDNSERVIRRTVAGDLSTLIDTSGVVDGTPYRGARFLNVFANDVVVTGMYGTVGPSGRPVTVAVFSGDGPGAEWERSVASTAMQTLNSIDVAGSDAATAPDVYVNDLVFRRLHRIDGDTQEIDPVLFYNSLVIEGLAVTYIHDVVVDGADLLMLVDTDAGSSLVRRASDATMTVIFGPDTPIGDEGQPPEFVTGIEVDAQGDIYVTGPDRVVRLPESGSCAAQRPDLVQVAASVNCDDELDIIDALVIAQYDASVRSARYSCPLADTALDINAATADVNRDGSVDIIDALTVAICVAGGTHPACP